MTFELNGEGRKGISCGNSRRGLRLEHTHVQTLKEKSLLPLGDQCWATACTWPWWPQEGRLGPLLLSLQVRLPQWSLGGFKDELEFFRGRTEAYTPNTNECCSESWRAPCHRCFWMLVTTYWHWSRAEMAGDSSSCLGYSSSPTAPSVLWKAWPDIAQDEEKGIKRASHSEKQKLLKAAYVKPQVWWFLSPPLFCLLFSFSLYLTSIFSALFLCLL